MRRMAENRLNLQSNLIGKRANSFSLFHQITTYNEKRDKRRLPAHTIRGVSIGGIRQYYAGCGNPDGIELFIKSASRLFFQIEIQREAILRLTTICQTKN